MFCFLKYFGSRTSNQIHPTETIEASDLQPSLLDSVGSYFGFFMKESSIDSLNFIGVEKGKLQKFVFESSFVPRTFTVFPQIVLDCLLHRVEFHILPDHQSNLQEVEFKYYSDFDERKACERRRCEWKVRSFFFNLFLSSRFRFLQ
jgi:hypothetical protein